MDPIKQSIWPLLNNQKKKTRIGANYEPQEDMTPNNELKTIIQNNS